MRLFPIDESPKEPTGSGQLIGMDEAGYGPNLGPMVVAISVWNTPDSPQACDPWRLLAAGVSQKKPTGEQLIVGDSKGVYQPGKGLAVLERTVLALLSTLGFKPTSFQELCRQLHITTAIDGGVGSCFADAGPWLKEMNVSLPFTASAESIRRGADCFAKAADSAGFQLKSLHADVVSEPRFNRLVERYDSKGETLSRTAMSLLHHVFPKTGTVETLVIGDKHGGRNRYAGLLSESFDGAMPQILEEGTPISRYRFPRTELRFQAKGEQEFPVAVASMVAKYLRELAMECFNLYWCERIPDLAPTKGYPQDARRFYSAIREIAPEEVVPTDLIWRSR
ncbi:MAG: hypothetical protein R3C01_17650 [Planctomycetaceae bacterium]